MLDHLVQNAFDAAGSEGRVALRARAVGNSALIEVEDDGPGMDLEFVRQKLFRPFRSTRSTGFGIGAYQIREYVRSMGGRLEVRTAPGMGTTMQVFLPLVTSDHEGVVCVAPRGGRPRELVGTGHSVGGGRCGPPEADAMVAQRLQSAPRPTIAPPR